MLLTISTTHRPATDLGFLMHKHPDRLQTFSLSFGQCHVFYPQADQQRCSIALLLDVDPIEMARGKKRASDFALAGYVNDRPFVASSFMSVAIAQVLGSALAGRCNQRPDLPALAMPLEVAINVLPVRGGESFLRRVFEPLGYQVTASPQWLDDHFTDWGESHYYCVRLKNELTVAQLLNHLYVLIPVFDHQKHYFVGRDESEKLLAKGKGWLETHPDKEIITHRYLKYQPSLARQTLAQLCPETVEADHKTNQTDTVSVESELEEKLSLHQQRLQVVTNHLIESGATRMIDFGCGEGKLIQKLIKQWQFKEIVGVDVSVKALEIASRRLRLEDLPSFQADRVKLMHGSLMYRDSRFKDFDAAAIVEVIEHLDPPRLAAFERVVFRHARPKWVIVTTPNREYNVMWPSLPAGKFRHSDHRFEWSRLEFQTWCQSICQQYKYQAEYFSIGPTAESTGESEPADVGAPTQMAVFKIAN